MPIGRLYSIRRNYFTSTIQFTSSAQKTFKTTLVLSYFLVDFFHRLSLFCLFTWSGVGCYTAMCLAGLQGAVRSRQLHQLKQGTHVGCDLSTIFNITDITNSLAEQHFKAISWVIGELLKFNTANWLAFPLKYKSFYKYKSFDNKRRLWTAVFGSTRLK